MKSLVIDKKMKQLQKSKFRSSFYLKDSDFKYIEQKGLSVIEQHAFDFIRTRLSSKIKNDGRQTPMRGPPVFIAQHATATCCRKCLYKWHHIPIDKELNLHEEQYIVQIIMSWIVMQYKEKDFKNNIERID